jgi:hypothetical protein
MRSWWWVEVPPETCKAVSRYKLCNVPSCWICIGIQLGAHYILHISRLSVNVNKNKRPYLNRRTVQILVLSYLFVSCTTFNSKLPSVTTLNHFSVATAVIKCFWGEASVQSANCLTWPQYVIFLFSTPRLNGIQGHRRSGAFWYSAFMSHVYYGCVMLQINSTRCTILFSIFISLLYIFRATMCP